MITIEYLRERFFARERTEEVPVAVGDDVVVTSGDHEGKLGAAISLETLGPALAVLIEFSDASDVIVAVDSIRRIEP